MFLLLLLVAVVFVFLIHHSIFLRIMNKNKFDTRHCPVVPAYICRHMLPGSEIILGNLSVLKRIKNVSFSTTYFRKTSLEPAHEIMVLIT